MSTSLLVVSDIHLTARFEQAKFDCLSRLIADASKVILNGDIWDTFCNDPEESAAAGWENLFPLLLQKQAIYLFGNRDPYLPGLRQFYERFSATQADSHELNIDGIPFHFEHGHRIIPGVGKRFSIPRFLLRYGSALSALEYHLRGGFPRRYANYNRVMKKWKQDHLSPETFLICGHSHWQEVDLVTGFANSGTFTLGRGQHLLLGEKAEIQARDITY